MENADSMGASLTLLEDEPRMRWIPDRVLILAGRGGILIRPSRDGDAVPFSPRSRLWANEQIKTDTVKGTAAATDERAAHRNCALPLIGEFARACDQRPYIDAERVYIHDINNILSVIGGGLRLLERQHDPDARETIIERMHRAVERGTRLSRCLIDKGRVTQPDPRSFTCRGDLVSALETLEHALSSRSRLGAEICAELWEFSADPEQLYYALLNLCRNADGAMLSGGVVTISAINVPAAPCIPFGAVAITVADNGSGMSQEVLARAFDPYFTTKIAGIGSGLGLVQVARFVEEHQGAIRLESQLGIGTTVQMIFSRVQRDEDRTETPSLQDEGAASHRRKISYRPSQSGGSFYLDD